ncbi:alpha-L-rhamnosidase-related protein [Metabacillus sp. Hm71]|uniref:alpha-L-rhamnosidase-related protein n=1 Tax=Metabacillus sp. Hm71 TaxID=3450743 RepID=UPI003F43AAE4
MFHHQADWYLQTQTAHVLALMFDLVDGKVKERTAFELNELIVQNNYHLTTGFVGTPYLCLALSKAGYHETAVRLLMQDDYPSWLYSIKKRSNNDLGALGWH